MPSIEQEEETRERLLNNVKKEVKQLMEFSVSCRFIHEDNCCITSLCTAIDACLLHGLKRDLTLNKRSSFQLLKIISKDCEEARYVVEICESLVDNYSNTHSDNLAIKSNLFGLESSITRLFSNYGNSKITSPELIKSYQPLFSTNLTNLKLFWLKVAIIEKKVATILECIQGSASKHYHPYALMSDSVFGPMVAQLLAGPCALEYTRIKTCDSLFTDQNADELIRRHKIHSQLVTGTHGVTGMKMGNLMPEKIASSNAFGNGMVNSWTCLSPIKSPKGSREHSQAMASTSNTSYNAKEYVESLHQNMKTQLIYGKNHISVNKHNRSIPGYLSLHQSQNGLVLNWTPNELLNSNNVEIEQQHHSKHALSCLRDIIHIEMDKISYFCCNQRLDFDSIIIFVAHDGVQYPSIVFPLGSHLIQFVNCLENALMPESRLEPLGWENLLRQSQEPVILKKVQIHDKVESKVNNQQDHNDSSNISEKSINNTLLTPKMTSSRIESRLKLKSVCNDMRYRIVSRAFYGWYQHYKQVKTLNKHLLKLIQLQEPTENLKDHDQDDEAKEVANSNDLLLNQYINENRKLDATLWDTLLETRKFNRNLFYKLVYRNGIENNELRKRVWPYLLGHYSLDMSQDELEAKDKETQHYYLRMMSEWQAIESYLKRKNEKNLSESSITPIKNSSNIEDDSGLGSEYTTNTNTASSSSISSLATAMQVNPIQETQFKRKQSFSTTKAKQMQTPIRSSLATTNGQNVAGKISKSKNRIHWSSPIAKKTINMKAYQASSNDVDLSSIINKAQLKIMNKFNAKTFLSKLIPPRHDLSRSTPMVSNEKRGKKSPIFFNDQKLSPDAVNKELAQLLVANAVLRAKHEIEQQHDAEDFSISEIHTSAQKSITFNSPTSDESSSDLLGFNSSSNNQHSSINHLEKNSTSYFSSPFLQLESTQVFQKNDSSLLFKKKLHHDESREYLSPILDDVLANKDSIDAFAMNMHRIDKDVLRCDRNYWYFMSKGNLEKLKNVIYTYIWETLDVGYVQGMCDLIAPLLVLFDNECLVFECFKKLMNRLENNFLYSSEMDRQFSEMSFLVQILDNELHEYMKSKGDHTQFYFTYRWFLLDFKREFSYDDIFGAWDTLLTAKHVTSEHFHLFIALALVETYRDIIIENQMDFTNIIKFFNEMSEKHNVSEIMALARDLVDRLRYIISDQK